jgi:DNA-binding PadR family transcriptional regulator/Ni2+-binding GTPase involved in maturation of urease and hydrogenase
MDFSECSCSGKSLGRMLRPAILGVLAGAPVHGYVVLQRLEELSMYRDSPPDAGGVYRMLKSMQDEGLVESTWQTGESGPAKRRYELTDTGRACLAEWEETLRAYAEQIKELVGMIEDAVEEVPPKGHDRPAPTRSNGDETNTVKLIIVGGFLGAGKTTLLWEAARRLTEQGRRVGLITNDQAPDLVDTGILFEQGLDVREVAGSCFCCNFDGLIDAADSLRHEVGADVLIAEPVGSCTDLSATIIQPLKDRFRDRFELAPLSVMADPLRMGNVLLGRGKMHRSAAYILKKQMEEADVILLNKADLLPQDALDKLSGLVEKEFPDAELRTVSALEGRGVDDWLDEMLASTRSGGHVVEVDYDTYAEGEAVLGWLNAEIRLSPAECCADWPGLARRLLKRLHVRCRELDAPIGHIKLLLSADGQSLVGNLTSLEEDVSVRGALNSPRSEAKLILNARVEMPPDDLRDVAMEELERVAGQGVDFEVMDVQCLRPGRPEPTHRYKQVVE